MLDKVCKHRGWMSLVLMLVGLVSLVFLSVACASESDAASLKSSTSLVRVDESSEASQENAVIETEASLKAKDSEEVSGGLPSGETTPLPEMAVYAANEDGVKIYSDATLSTVSKTLGKMMVIVISATDGEYAVSESGEYVLMSQLVKTTCSVDPGV